MTSRKKKNVTSGLQAFTGRETAEGRRLFVKLLPLLLKGVEGVSLSKGDRLHLSNGSLHGHPQPGNGGYVPLVGKGPLLGTPVRW